MFGQLFKLVAGVVVTYMVREAIRFLTSPKRPPTQPVQPSPKTARIHIDRKNIVDARFEDLPDQKPKP
ncbi:MAG: hypothetical protein FJY97_10370 [candidate division Zixibacteria bacterium]|nr:hypothetical protein [candidate division Zixibacteria bacterium]